MSEISFTRSALRSQVVRNIVGERTVDIFRDITTPEERDEESGLFRWVIGLAKRLAGFLLSVAGRAIGWLARNIWGIIVESALTIYSFDWNQTDSSLESEISQLNNQIAEQLGETLGSGAVWAVTIGLAGAASTRFPVLGGRVAIALAEEGGEELRGQILSLIQVSRQSLTRAFVLRGLLTARRLRLFGLEPISQAREPWSIAQQVDNAVEALPDELIQPFVEGLLEGASDAIIEAGYVISYAIDDYYSSTRIANENLLGEQRAVKLYPDRANEEEFVVIRGPQELVKQEIQTALTTQAWVRHRDVGNIYGTPTGSFQESVKFRPQIRLYFIEDLEDVEEGYPPITGEITFRLMQENSQSITPAKGLSLATRVKSQFGDSGGFRWHKGRVKVWYRDSDRGYNLSLNVVTEAEGRRVASNVLDIQQHSFDAEFVTVSQLAEQPPIVPGNELVYGQPRRAPRRRPVGWVRFVWAELYVHGMVNPVTLVDRTYRRPNALLRV